MSYIRWSTKVGKRAISSVYAWSEGRRGVVIVMADNCKRATSSVGDRAVRLSQQEMLFMCRQYLEQNGYRVRKHSSKGGG